MNRRNFLSLPLAWTAGALPSTPVEGFFRAITEGFLHNAARTSSSLAVVEYPNATVTKSFLAKSGLSATGVTRMLPALAAWAAAGRDSKPWAVGKERLTILDVIARGLANGLDPAHADYWQPAPAGQWNQRQVESGVVAWSVWQLREQLLPKLGETGRRNLAAWLESCTQTQVRRNNWAWFTAVNQAVRLDLSAQWPEFQGDEAWMLDDLKALDAMGVGDSGWYDDGPDANAFDYYNSWVFASHFLYWDEVIGARFPEWRRRFAARLKKYLETAPLFFAADGGHLLYGRSLIYRFGVLTPLVLAYRRGLWPHSPGLLRHIVEENIRWHQRSGGFDARQGKLLESYTPGGSPAIRESYIDGGHPYWGMQAFALWLIPGSDPFWTARPAHLPVEEGDGETRLDAPGLLLVRDKAAGTVRLLQGRSSKPDAHYRDKYNKFSYWSAFPFSATHERFVIPWDNALIVRDGVSGRHYGRGPFTRREAVPHGWRLDYEIKLPEGGVRVSSTITAQGESERRTHAIDGSGVPAAARRKYEMIEGSPACGGAGAADFKESAAGRVRIVTHASGRLVAARRLDGWRDLRLAADFGDASSSRSNTAYPEQRIITLSVPLPAELTLDAAYYASPKPLAEEEIVRLLTPGG